MSTSAEHNPFVAPQSAVDDDESFADSSFKLNLFSAAGRIGRVRYLGYSMGIGLLIILAGVVLAAITTPTLAIVAYFAMLYVNFMLTIKRCHDFDTTGWLSLLLFVPLINLMFLFIPGTDGPNRFGRKTAPNGSTGVVIVVVIFVGIAVMGILAAIAIPAYHDYTVRAQAAHGTGQSLPAPQ